MKKIWLFCFFVWLPIAANAWNALGHMVIADIAYQQLNSSTKEQVDSLVDYMQREYPEMDTFAKIAYWPDELHAQKIDTFTHWHYVDTAISLDGTPIKNVMDTDNAIWAITKIEPVMMNTHVNTFEKARFLSFLVHIVGDLHQPMHTVSSFSAKTPNGDQGGNLYLVRYNNQSTNLHSIWDSGCDVFSGEATEENAGELAMTLMRQYSQSYFGDRLNDLKPDDWVKDELVFAKKSIYNIAYGQPLSEKYVDVCRNKSAEQVVLAGYQLAKILNQML